MPQGFEGMIQQHPGPGIAHHGPNLFPLCRSVAMNLALFAGAFERAVAAGFQPPAGVGQQAAARLAQLRVVLLATAIEAYHPLYRPFFPFDAIHPISSLRSAVPANDRGTSTVLDISRYFN